MLTRLRNARHALRGAEEPVPQHQHPRLRRRTAKLESLARRQGRRLSHLAPLPGQVEELRARILELEADLQEQRALGARIAELTDVVAHILGAAASGDHDEFERAVAKYSDGL